MRSYALVVLLLGCLQAHAQFVVTTSYLTQGCQGEAMSYTYTPLNLCVYLGSYPESILTKLENETVYTTYTYATIDCSGDPAIVMPTTLNTCVEWGGNNGVYYSGSYSVADSAVAPSTITTNAYQVSTYPSCEETSIILQRFVFTPKFCYSDAPGTSWYYETCNSTSYTKNYFSGSTTCSGGSAEQVVEYKGCVALPFYDIQECYGISPPNPTYP